MNSLFKFPRRVRIHGGECGAVARALHHKAQKVALTQNEQTLISDECVLMRLADLKKSFRSTFLERKQMSTKTSIKRIALVAVSALGFGLLSVMPAKAAAIAVVSIGTPPTRLASSTSDLSIAIDGGVGTVDIAVKLVTPTGTAIYEAVEGSTEVALTGNLTLAAVTTTDSTLTIPYAQLQEPGSYSLCVIGANNGTADSIDTAAEINPACADVTAINTTITVLSPASATGMAVQNDKSVFVQGTDSAIVRAWRNTNGTSGTLKALVTQSQDADLVVNEVYAATSGNKMTITAGVNVSTFTLGSDVTGLGTYGLTIWTDTDNDAVVDSTEPSVAATLVYSGAVATGGVAVSIDKSLVAKTTASDALGYNTFTVTVTLTDSLGRPSWATATLAEASALTSVGAPTTLTRVGTSNVATGTFTVDADYTAADFIDNKLTATANSITGTADLRIVNIGNIEGTLGSFSVNDVVGIGSYTDGVRQSLSGTGTAGSGDLTLDIDRTVTTQTYTVTGANGSEGEYILFSAAPSAGTSTSVVPTTSALVKIGNDLSARYSVTATSPANLAGYALTVTGGNDANVVSTVTFKTAAPAFTTSPAGNWKAKYGDAVSITATLADNYGRILGDKEVTATVTGRNQKITTGLKTSSTGEITLSYTDASASTTVLVDTITFEYKYLATAASTSLSTLTSTARTVTFSSTGVAVASVVVTPPSSVTDRPIDQAQDGTPQSASQVVYTATVKDSTGAPVASGVVVTFAGGTDDLFIGGKSGITNEFGVATATVYRQKAGAASITATANGIKSSASTPVQWRALVRDTDATSTGEAILLTADYLARYITLSSDPATSVSEGTFRFVAKVTDRFGNPVSGVQVTFTESGAGRFATGASTTPDTNTLGEASIDFTSAKGEVGTASVTATITDTNSKQVDDVAGSMSFVTIDSDTNNGTAGQDTDFTVSTTTTPVTGLTAAVKSATASATITKDTSVSTADALLELAKAQTAAAEATKAAEAARKATEDANAAALLELAKAIGTGKSVEEAADAAAEAIDAANAATDAANLAAEAADAATVAAEEARDAADSATAAVEELATQVATLMAALKAQLTTLANTVAKIAKKVKA
jgi:hypothetical protein